jgi:hypothetical protein
VELAPHIEPKLKAVGWTRGSAEEFLRAIRDESGLLTGWGVEHYGFMHLGFQEYLAAREIRSRAFTDHKVLRELASHYGESWWQEVFLLLLSCQKTGGCRIIGRLLCGPCGSDREQKK